MEEGMKEFLDDLRKKTIGISNGEFYIYILEQMKKDPRYQVSEAFLSTIDDIIKNGYVIQDVEKEIMAPLEEVYEEEEKKEEEKEEEEKEEEEKEEEVLLEEEAKLEEEDSSDEAPSSEEPTEELVEMEELTPVIINEEIEDINQEEETKEEETNEKYVNDQSIALTAFLVTSGFLTVDANTPEYIYQMAFGALESNTFGALLGAAASLENISILLSMKDGIATMSLSPKDKNPETLNKILEEINNNLNGYNPEIDYKDLLPDDLKEAMSLMEKMMLEKETLQIGMKFGENDLKEFMVRSKDPDMIEKIREMGILDENGKFIMKSGNEKEREIFLKAIGVGLESENSLEQSQEEKQENNQINEEDLNDKNSVITVYEKPIDENNVARISVITPINKETTDLGLEKLEPSQDRFVELSVEDKASKEASLISKRFRYENGNDFDNYVLPNIASDYKKSVDLVGNHFEQDPENPMNYIITSPDGEKKTYMKDTDNQISNKDSVSNFIENTNFGGGAKIDSWEEKKVAEGNLEKQITQEKQKVKTLSYPSAGSVISNSAGKATSLLLIMVIIMQIAATVGMLLLMR